MRVAFALIFALGLGACHTVRQPAQYPAVTIEDSVVTSAEAAIEAVRAYLDPDPSAYDLNAAMAREGPGEWWVEVPFQNEPGEVSTPTGTGFRVSKATGAVDVPYPRR